MIEARGPNSLALSPTAASQAITLLAPGFKVAVMKMLLPAETGISKLPQYTSSTFAGICPTPAYDTSVPPDTISNRTWNDFMIQGPPGAACSSIFHPGAAAIQSDVFGNGANPYDFFNGTNGWNFTVSYNNNNNNSAIWKNTQNAASSCTALLVQLSYQTPNALTLYITQVHGSLLGNAKRTLPGYAAATLGSQNRGGLSHGPDMEVGVDYPDGNEIAQFDVQQDDCLAEAEHYLQTGEHQRRLTIDKSRDVRGIFF